MIRIRCAKGIEWENVMSLAWRVFQIDAAPLYSKEGQDSFLNFISDERLYQMFKMGAYPVFVAVKECAGEAAQLVGMLSLRNKNLISLLFVDKEVQRQGIGKELVQFACGYIWEEYRQNVCYVKAAPNAVGFYETLGFVRCGDLQEYEGIQTYPMRYAFQGLYLSQR